MELLIPSTFASDERDQKLLVYRVGNLARTAAIFGVDKITIYKDDDPKTDEERNAELMAKYLRYAETPPYLRKELIPHDPDLKLANILPPLQILSHGYTDQFREAAVTGHENDTALVNAGLDDPVELADPDRELETGERITLMQADDGDDAWSVIDPAGIEGFWTFDVENERRNLGAVLEDQDPSIPVIGTSAKGDPLPAFEQSDYVDQEFALVFGSAWRGIYDLADRGDCTEDQFDGIYNFVPDQHTKTVRTSEAVTIVLSIINAMRH